VAQKTDSESDSESVRFAHLFAGDRPMPLSTDPMTDGAVRADGAAPVDRQLVPADRQLVRPVGAEWVIDAAGCEPDRLTCLATVDEICQRLIGSLQLRVIGQRQAHQFGPPHGVTALYLLSESHLACHTYPEHGLATWNLVCCRDVAEWPWRGELERALGATSIEIRRLPRGVWQ